MDSSLSDFLNLFTDISKKPFEFLSIQEEKSITIKELLKQLYDFNKKIEDQRNKNTLPELIVDNFDEEQIWQELELQNENSTNNIIENVSQLCVKKDKLTFPLKLKSNKNKIEEENSHVNGKNNEVDELEAGDINNDVEDDEDEEEIEDDGDEDLTDGDISESENENIVKKGKLKPSIVDDQFFKLAELELFLQDEERKENKPRKEKEQLDLFDEIDDGGADYKYSDFFENPDNESKTAENDETMENDDDFDEPSDDEENDEENESKRKKTKRKRNEADKDGSEDDMNVDEELEDGKSKTKKVRFSLLGSDDDEDSGEEELLSGSKKPKPKINEPKSSFEQRQERLGRVIEKLEDEALSEKPWQLKGEVTANARPQNSLLEEALDFDLSMRPAPLRTEQVTLRLEDIISQRIKDQAWDDVERKVKPVDTPSEFKKKLALDQEKSKLSLAEVYEQEFIKQREAATADDTERQETEPALHVEVRSMLHSLFNKLDALSNYHYTPRPVAPELKVVSNVAAITMEEVAPVAVADSTLLAPQEVKGKKRKGELMSKEERTKTDKKRARRLKKTKQRQRQREKEKAAKEVAKINPGLGNKYSKLKVEKQLLDTSRNNVTKVEETKEKSIRSSTAFFNKLQDEVKTQIKSKTSPFAKKKDKQKLTAKKLKL